MSVSDNPTAEFADGAPPASRLAVTGATGRLGGRVARRLAEADVPQRLLVRDTARVAADLANAPGVSLAQAAYDDPGGVARALAGIETLFMVSAAEQHIRSSGMGFTFLRDNLYADFVPLLADEHGVIRGPAGSGKVSVVALDDIADVASIVLRDLVSGNSVHRGRSYDLTGPQALSLAEAAQILSEVGGTPISYHDETVAEAYASRAGHQAPDWLVEAWVSTYLAIGAGELDGVSSAVLEVTGRRARGLGEVVQGSL